MTASFDLQEIRALLDVHPNLGLPWSHEYVGRRGGMGDSEITGVDSDGDEIDIAVVTRESEPPWNLTADLIVAAVNALPALVDAVEAAQAWLAADDAPVCAMPDSPLACRERLRAKLAVFGASA